MRVCVLVCQLAYTSSCIHVFTVCMSMSLPLYVFAFTSKLTRLFGDYNASNFKIKQLAIFILFILKQYISTFWLVCLKKIISTLCMIYGVICKFFTYFLHLGFVGYCYSPIISCFIYLFHLLHLFLFSLLFFFLLLQLCASLFSRLGE